MEHAEVITLLRRLEKSLTSALSRFAGYVQTRMQDHDEDMAQLFCRVTYLENELAAAVQREKQRHG